MERITKAGTLKCPQCGADLEVFTREDHVFWPEGVLEVIMTCSKCGYRTVDVFPVREMKPNRQELKVSTQAGLNVRVVKSSKATLRIPEFGIEIAPGPASQGYITNVEGVLDRIEDVLLDMVKWNKKGAQQMLDRIRSVREKVSEPFTLIIEDPTGSSLIISEKTKKIQL
jgi:zinc finger protein